MKTKRRHKLETNELADRLGRVVERVRPYQKPLALGLIAVLVAVLAGSYAIRRSRAVSAEAWSALSSAGTPEEFAAVASHYSDSPASTWAMLRAADGELFQGVYGLFRDREQALVHLRAAQRGYEQLSEKTTGMPFFDERVLMGLGRASESLVELDKARQAYQQVLDRFPEGAFAEEAQKRIEALDDPETASFYSWLQEAELKSDADVGTEEQGKSAEPAEGEAADSGDAAATQREASEDKEPDAGRGPSTEPASSREDSRESTSSNKGDASESAPDSTPAENETDQSAESSHSQPAPPSSAPKNEQGTSESSSGDQLSESFSPQNP